MIENIVHRTSIYLAEHIESHSLLTGALTVATAVAVLGWPNVIYALPDISATGMQVA